jgi:hypothetical protein
MTRKIASHVPRAWADLNELLMATTNEKTLEALITKEKAGENRPTFIKRIHARLNKVRADRERRELL